MFPQRRQASGKPGLDACNPRLPGALQQQVDTLRRHRAGKRVRHERRPVHEDASGRSDGAGHPIRTHRGRKGHVAPGERLAQAKNVGHRGRVLVGEEPACASKAGGDLVKNQQDFVLVAEAPDSIQIPRMVEAHPAGTLNYGFEDHRRQFVRMRFHEPPERLHFGLVPGLAGSDTRRRREQLPGEHSGKQLVHAGDRVAYRHGAESVTVIAPLDRQQPMLARCSRRLPELQRHLDGHFHGY